MIGPLAERVFVERGPQELHVNRDLAGPRPPQRPVAGIEQQEPPQRTAPVALDVRQTLLDKHLAKRPGNVVEHQRKQRERASKHG